MTWLAGRTNPFTEILAEAPPTVLHPGLRRTLNMMPSKGLLP
jgi:hypothetical protein